MYLIDKRKKIFYSKLKSSNFQIRKAIINLKVINEQQNFMKKSISFNA